MLVAFPNIEKRDGVCGGEACVLHTRIPIWLLEQARRLGASQEQLFHSYPALTPALLAQAWEYAEANQQEIDSDIRGNEED